MSVTINGTTGITVPGITNTGNTTLGDGSADSTRINKTMVVGTDTDNVKMSTSAAITTVVLGDSSGVSGAAARLSYNRVNGAVKLTTGTNDAPIERLSMDNYGSFTIPGNVTMNSQNSGPLAGFRNRIINGGFDVWQRGTSMSGTNPNFGPDRFMTQSDASQTLSRVDYISSASGLYAARFTKNNTATYINFGTVIENGYNNALVGNVVTFSCLMRASSAITLSMQILKGTGFDIVTQLSSVDKSVTTSWTKFSITLDGTALSYDGTNKHLRVSIGNLGGLAISGWVEFKDFQLEVGLVATPFEYRPIGTELALCQRYYEIFAATLSTASRVYVDTFPYKAEKLKTPVLALFSGTAYGATLVGGVLPTQSARVGVIPSQTTDIVYSANAEL